MELRIALVQYDPVIKERDANMRKVDAMLQDLKPGDIDILLLPEMAFTGYMFVGDEIDPFLEDSTGPSIAWAKATATRLKTYVMFGFAERCRETGKRFNSLAIISWTGQLEVSI
jgi:protein N-terminal amidase